MKDFIYNEMMVHVGVCTNKQPERVLLISNSADGFVAEMKKHDGIAYDVIAASTSALREAEDAKYDVIISELDSDAAVLAHYNRVLKVDGLLVSKHPSLDDVAANTTMMQVLGKYTKSLCPLT